MKDWTGNQKSTFVTLGASNHTEKEREINDYYATDAIAIDALIQSGVKLNHKIWECAAGEGHLAERLKEYGYEVRATDLIDRGYGQGQIDFLEQKDVWDGDILTNPPYKYAQEFVEKAMELVADGRKVFMFLKLQFLEGKKRRLLFDKYPPKTVYVSSSRILCAKNGMFETCKMTGGSAVAYAWYEFEKGYNGETILKWIN